MRLRPLSISFRNMAMNAHRKSTSEAWYRQPIAWLGVAIFLVSMAGCVWMIMVSLRYDETLTHDASTTILGVPATAQSAAATP